MGKQQLKITEFLKSFIKVLPLISLLMLLGSCQKSPASGSWNEKYDFIYDLQPITFHYDHGIIAGSYPSNHETTQISFDDVSHYLGHVCLCGAGGYKISETAINTLTESGENLERGDFILISSRDHTVSDVIAYVLGCSRRNDLLKNQYFIDSSIEAPKREYHYYIGYPLQNKAVHILYRKHLLIGNELMDRLWKVELVYEEDSSTVSSEDIKLYQDTMYQMIQDVLLNQKDGLFTVETINYAEFLSILNPLMK